MNSQSSISFPDISGELAGTPRLSPPLPVGAAGAVLASRNGVWRIPSGVRSSLKCAVASVVAAAGYPVIYYVAGGPLYGAVVIFLVALKYWVKEFSPKTSTKAQL